MNDVGRVTRTVPCRVDLSGGTLDLWPLYLYFGGLELVNMAIDVKATADITYQAANSFRLTVISNDLNARSTYGSLEQLSDSLGKTTRDNPLRWINRIANHWLNSRVGTRVEPRHWTITTKSEAPPGSGLGGSSVLGIALQLAFYEILRPEEFARLDDAGRWRLQQQTRDLEACEIEHPAGDQDYVPALFGGLIAMHLNESERRVEPLPKEAAQFVASHCALLYTGKPHHSGLNNWQIFKSLHDGDSSVSAALREIRNISARVAEVMRSGRFGELSDLVNLEWEQRRRLSPAICPQVLDEAWAHAEKLGATSRKACGSGGGGCMLFVFADAGAKAAAVASALPSVDWKWLSTATVG